MNELNTVAFEAGLSFVNKRDPLGFAEDAAVLKALFDVLATKTDAEVHALNDADLAEHCARVWNSIPDTTYQMLRTRALLVEREYRAYLSAA